MTKRKEPENMESDPVLLDDVEKVADDISSALKPQQDNVFPIGLPEPKQQVPSLLFAPSEGNLYTSFDLSTETGRKCAYLAKEDKSIPLASLEGKEIEITHVLCHDAHTVAKDSGEIIPLVRIVFVGPDGKQYDTVSTGIRACIGTLAIKKGLPPWLPSVKVRVSKSGRMLRLASVT